LAKLLATIVTDICYDILVPEQAGFRRLKECVAQATTLVEALQRRKNAGKRTWVCFIDFTKAYDTVPHAGLIAKLRSHPR
jgi:hypothetical protein